MDLTREVRELAGRILGETATPDGAGVDRKAWDALAESGLTELLRPAEAGGAGADWPETMAVLTEVGAAAARVPVAEHDVLAGWLLRRAGLPETDGSAPRTAGVVRDGVARAVPWAREAGSVVLLCQDGDGWRVSVTSPDAAEIVPGENLAGEYRDDVRPAERPASGARVDADVAEEYRLRLALSRALMIAGAAGTVLELVMEHATSREQFGRPLAKFQAVQNMVATVAAEGALIRAAAGGAVGVVREAGVLDRRARVAVLSAASCAAHGAAVVVRNAHQVLGAMGYTLEHPLHRFTNRMLSWRSEAGSVHDIDSALLRETAGMDPVELWSLVADTGPVSPQTLQ